MRANEKQEGGTHYVQFGELQPWDVILRFGLGYLDGNAVEYLLQWRHKGGLEDIKKARHYLDKLIESEGNKPESEEKESTRNCDYCSNPYPLEDYLVRKLVTCSCCREGT